jgi:hypothetical protein
MAARRIASWSETDHGFGAALQITTAGACIITTSTPSVPVSACTRIPTASCARFATSCVQSCKVGPASTPADSASAGLGCGDQHAMSGLVHEMMGDARVWQQHFADPGRALLRPSRSALAMGIAPTVCQYHDTLATVCVIHCSAGAMARTMRSLTVAATILVAACLTTAIAGPISVAPTADMPPEGVWQDGVRNPSPEVGEQLTSVFHELAACEQYPSTTPPCKRLKATRRLNACAWAAWGTWHIQSH